MRNKSKNIRARTIATHTLIANNIIDGCEADLEVLATKVIALSQEVSEIRENGTTKDAPRIEAIFTEIEVLNVDADEITMYRQDVQDDWGYINPDIHGEMTERVQAIESRIDELVTMLDEMAEGLQVVALSEPVSERQQAIDLAYCEIENLESDIQIAKDSGSYHNGYPVMLQIAVEKYETLINEPIEAYKARIKQERADLQAMIDAPFKPRSWGEAARFNEVESYYDGIDDAQMRIKEIDRELQLV